MAPLVTMAGEEKSTKKKRDPIFSVCFVIFVVAAVAVLGSFINSEYIQKDTTEVAYGDKVVVDYTGSYYNYYDKDKAMIFDTSFKSIGESSDYKKANDFSKTSYSTFDVTVGSNGALKMFEEALVGYGVGDTVRVKIPAGEGYVDAAATEGILSSGSVDITQKMTIDKFKSIYPDVTVTESMSPVTITTVYGWDALVTFDGSNVNIVNPTTGFEAEYVYSEDSALKVTDVSVVGSEIKFTYVLDKEKVVAVGNPVGGIQTIQMIKVNIDGKDVYITSYDTSSGEVYYKNTAERNNIDLYFVIVIRSIGS